MTLGQALAIREMDDCADTSPRTLHHEAEWDSLVASADALIMFTEARRVVAASESDAIEGVIVEDDIEEEQASV